MCALPIWALVSGRTLTNMLNDLCVELQTTFEQRAEVKQYVLVAERIGFFDRSKEVIYEALNAAGITIPFPQCDVHLIQES